MFLYDWQKIFEKAEGDPKVIFRIFKMMTTNQIPTNKYDKIYSFSHVEFIGTSFLVHPDVLLYNAYKHSYTEIAQYLATASLRPLSDYFATGLTRLDFDVLHIEPTYINDNSLLRMEGEQIVLLYEEVPKEKNKWH